MESVDGFHEGLTKDRVWHNVHAEFEDFAVRQLDKADMLVFGRVTYELMAVLWPLTTAEESSSLVASRMNCMPKVIFSTTFKSASWAGSTLLSGDATHEMADLKGQSAGELLVLGSARLTSGFMRAGLLDELRIMVNPVVFGQGTSLFHDARKRSAWSFLLRAPFPRERSCSTIDRWPKAQSALLAPPSPSARECSCAPVNQRSTFATRTTTLPHFDEKCTRHRSEAPSRAPYDERADGTGQSRSNPETTIATAPMLAPSTHTAAQPPAS